eukprot:COSAG04_NODE_2708_length_3698_cov_2.299250_3_plen_102_part_00
MVSKPEMDVITIKLRELQCTCYARSKKANEALACANRVHQHDGESIEAFKRKCEAHSTTPLPPPCDARSATMFPLFWSPLHTPTLHMICEADWGLGSGAAQ